MSSELTRSQPRYVWPGMENGATDFVYQNVIGDQQPEGEWSFATWYVGEGYVFLQCTLTGFPY